MAKNDPNTPRRFLVAARDLTPLPKGSSLVLIGLSPRAAGADWALARIVEQHEFLAATGVDDASVWTERNAHRRRSRTGAASELSKCRRFAREQTDPGLRQHWLEKAAEAKSSLAAIDASLAESRKKLDWMLRGFDTTHGVAFVPSSAFGLELVFSSRAPALFDPFLA